MPAYCTRHSVDLGSDPGHDHWVSVPQPDDDLKREFAAAMRDIYLRAKSEAGYNATYFLQMLSDLGPLETARRLVTSTQPSQGFTALWERHRLDLTVEARILENRFEPLFTDVEREAARERLDAYGYKPR
jgi:hypothetical protein